MSAFVAFLAGAIVGAGVIIVWICSEVWWQTRKRCDVFGGRTYNGVEMRCDGVAGHGGDHQYGPRNWDP